MMDKQELGARVADMERDFKVGPRCEARTIKCCVECECVCV